MTVFVDTSALYALGSVLDPHHANARTTLDGLLGLEPLVTNNYVVVETIALLTSRHGRSPVERLRRFLPVLECIWIDQVVHDAALDRLLTGPRDGPSFVDLVSFEVMERYGIEEAFAFDDDFVAAGFRLVSSR